MTSILTTGHALGDRLDNEAGKKRAAVVLVRGEQKQSLDKSELVRCTGRNRREAKFASSLEEIGQPEKLATPIPSGAYTFYLGMREAPIFTEFKV